MKYKIKITCTEKRGVTLEAVYSFDLYSEAEDFYNNFDYDSFPDDIKIKRLYLS